mmetsp:Transcript_24124/g.81091  ORF Transcript_24124/g.81091 Transcript_24124/m.81091 type:complete len:205 (+) Transcript_24124:883-1497(+)
MRDSSAASAPGGHCAAITAAREPLVAGRSRVACSASSASPGRTSQERRCPPPSSRSGSSTAQHGRPRGLGECRASFAHQCTSRSTRGPHSSGRRFGHVRAARRPHLAGSICATTTWSSCRPNRWIRTKSFIQAAGPQVLAVATDVGPWAPCHCAEGCCTAARRPISSGAHPAGQAEAGRTGAACASISQNLMSIRTCGNALIRR